MQPSAEELAFLRPTAREEVIWDTRYDKIYCVAATAIADMVFFQKNVGSAVPAAWGAVGNVASFWHTNMRAAGTMERGNRLFAKVMNFNIFDAVGANIVHVTNSLLTLGNVYSALMGIILQPSMMTKPYGEVQAYRVPAGGGMLAQTSATALAAGTAINIASETNGMASYNNAWPVKLPLEELMPFGVTALLRGPAVTPGTTNLWAEVSLSGWSVRAIL